MNGAEDLTFQGEYERPAWERLASLLVMRDDIEATSAHRPSAFVLPADLLAGAIEVYGLPVLRGPYLGLIFESEEPRAIDESDEDLDEFVIDVLDGLEAARDGRQQ